MIQSISAQYTYLTVNVLRQYSNVTDYSDLSTQTGQQEKKKWSERGTDRMNQVEEQTLFPFVSTHSNPSVLGLHLPVQKCYKRNPAFRSRTAQMKSTNWIFKRASCTSTTSHYGTQWAELAKRFKRIGKTLMYRNERSTHFGERWKILLQS